MPEHTYFKSGEWNAACDICGRVFKSSQLSKTWDNSMRCSACWETRHPQDFVRALPENPTVPWARPWSPTFAPVTYTGGLIGELTIGEDEVIGGP